MFVIVMNQNNLVQDGQNNKLVYKFPNSIQFKDKFIAVTSISMYYSWFNISSQYSNQTFTYTWTSGATTTTYTITIPDGLYEISDINAYAQYIMIQNGTYWIDSDSLNVYPFDFVVNANRYAIQLNTYLIPTSTPSGASTPSNFAGWPTTTQNTVITTPSSFNLIVGFASSFVSDSNISNSFVPSGSYVSKTADGTISYISTLTPQVQPNPSVLFSLSNINNPYSQPSSIIYSLTPSVSIGELITEKPPNFMWNKLIDGTYSELRLSILASSNLSQIKIPDPNMTILLCIKDASESFTK